MQNRIIEKLITKYDATSFNIENIRIHYEIEGENNYYFYIFTPQLNFHPATLCDLDAYDEMVKDKKTMQLYGTGAPWLKSYTAYRLMQWENLWSHNVPFSAFAITNKDDEFVGHIALDYDHETPQGCAEISYIIKEKAWNNGYASVATWTISNPYANMLRKNYLCQEQMFCGIYATARPDNPASLSVLLKSGFEIEQHHFEPKKTQWGERFTFFKKLNGKANLNDEKKERLHFSNN